MEYHNTRVGTFISRPNRFIAMVDIYGAETVCHVKNTGRCRELLIPGVRVVLEKSDNPARRTAFDLVSVWKGERLINIDSQAPNALAAEYLPRIFPDARLIKPECVYGASRLDFRVDGPRGSAFVEVKGVTLENNGLALFPDAPTVRGAKHMRELARARSEGCGAYVLFVLQMDGCYAFSPNDLTDPDFGRALREAVSAGVGVLTVACRVTETAMTALSPVPVIL